MKKQNTHSHSRIGLFAVMAFSLLLASCGIDGLDGRAFLSINYSGSMPSYYWDSNPSIPYGFTWGHRYITTGGTSYSYEYTYSDGSGWLGTNSVLTPIAGEDGGIFLDGDDGEDSYCDFYCSYYGSWTDDGWIPRATFQDTTFTLGVYDVTLNVIHGQIDTLMFEYRRGGQLVSIDKRWRKKQGEPLNPDHPNKLR
ncbi:MAG: hypothetical protein KDC12_15590 [Flavobacteriales bacterium]|nr:hypothetical protein [Flavobacteriales bacterium]